MNNLDTCNSNWIFSVWNTVSLFTWSCCIYYYVVKIYGVLQNSIWFFFQDGKFFLAQAGPHEDSLEELLYEYYSTDLPNTKVKLSTPYQLHPKYNC